MYTRIVGLKTDGLTHDQIIDIVVMVGRVCHGSGPGAGNRIGKVMEIQPVDGLRALVGVSDTWPTERRQRFLETTYNYCLGRPIGPDPSVWTDDPTWQPRNPRAADVPLRQAELDLDFIAGFGLAMPVFDRDVLQAGGVLSRTKQGTATEADKLRAYFALSVFGFRDPLQFFHAPE
jgi:hypothetical protein